MSAAIWTTLGLKRTSDVAEIRRAYARRLKQTDVDADPDSFIALRDALNRALAWAASRPGPARDDTADEIVPPDRPFEPMPADLLVTEAPAADAETEPAEPADDGARFARLEALLFNAPEEWPDPAELEAAVREICEHPQMHHIEHDASVQFWLAQALYDSFPRSGSVHATVVDRFGWEQGSGQIDQPWLFEVAVERRRGLELAEAAERPGHRFSTAWADLTSTKEKLGLRPPGRAREVRHLLSHIRAHCPSAEQWLNPQRVALWDEKFTYVGPSGGTNFAIIGIFAALMLVRIFSSLSQPAPVSAPPIEIQAPPTSQLSDDPNYDLADILEPLLGPEGPALLEAVNPGVYGQLVELWRRERADGRGRYALSDGARDVIDTAISDGLRGGNAELQTDYFRFHADRLKWMRDESSGRDAACGDFLAGSASRVVLPNALAERLRQLQARALLAPPETTRPRLADHRFVIPAGIFETARRRSGLDTETFRAALLGEGTPAARCNASIAVLDAALEQPPRVRTPFLRDMARAL